MSSAHFTVSGSARSPARNRARNEERSYVLQEFRLRILLLDGAKGRGRGEQRHDPMIGDHPPIGAGIGRAHRLALVENGRATMKERPIDDVGMADHPADVRGGPEHLARLHAEEMAHGPFERDHVAAIVAHHALRNAGRTRGVEHVERIGGCDRHAFGLAPFGPRGVDGARPIPVAAVVKRACELRSLEDEAGFRLRGGERDRLVEQRLVGDDPGALDAAGGGEDDLRLGVVDAGRELLRRKAAEDHGMDRPDAGAGQHREAGLRDHRHVDDDAIAFDDAHLLQHGGQRRHLVLQLGIGDAALRVGDRAVVDDCRLVAARGDMPVDRVVAGVALSPDEPAPIDAGLAVEHLVRRPDPIDIPRGRLPESHGIGLPSGIDLSIAALGRWHGAPRCVHCMRLQEPAVVAGP